MDRERLNKEQKMAVHSTEGILQSKTQTLPAIETIDINSDKEAMR